MSIDTNPAIATRTFTQTVDAMRFGTLSEELTKALQQLTRDCQDTNKSGAITLKIQLKPGKGGQIELLDELIVKAPKAERGSTLMFPTPEGFLTRQDPRQKNLDLAMRVVEKTTAEDALIRAVAKG